jgi:G3E family GTPase
MHCSHNILEWHNQLLAPTRTKADQHHHHYRRRRRHHHHHHHPYISFSVMSTISCTSDEIPGWQKHLWNVFSVTRLHGFSIHQIASNSVTVW